MLVSVRSGDSSVQGLEYRKGRELVEFMEERSFGQNRSLDIKVLRTLSAETPASPAQPHPGAPASWLPADTACASLREALAPL